MWAELCPPPQIRMLKSYCQCLRVWLFRDRAFNEVVEVRGGRVDGL